MSNNESEFERRRRRLTRWDLLLTLIAMIIIVPFMVMIALGQPADKEYEENLPTGISPGKIHITDIDAGDYGEFHISIHNGNEEATEFSLTIRCPDNIPDIASGEHLALPEGCLDWLTVSELNPTLEPDETRSILISVQWPEVIELEPGIYEVYVSVVELGQTGMVIVELAVRVIMTME